MSASTSGGRVAYWGRLLARGILVIAFSTYGAAKFAGAQFITSGGILDKPVADLSGIDLTWVYFGYSPLYSSFVGFGQLVAAALLVFDRTARLGAAVLLPISANIVVVNFGFQIGVDTEIVSSILLALNLYLLAGDLPVWKRVFWDETADDPARPRFLAARGIGVVKGAMFAATVAGLFWLLVTQSKPAGGAPPVAGEWLVESATLDGRPTADPALGAGWLWVCFEPNGQLSVRTTRWTFRGRYTADATGVALRYDPEPIPPSYPGRQNFTRLSDAEMKRLIGEQLADFKWPVELSGTFRKEGHKLVVTVRRGAETIEWVLTPYTRPKF